MSIGADNIKDHNGFWSTLLKQKKNISIETLIDNHLKAAKG